MPEFIRNNTTIYYEITGNGFPILAIAPGGLKSAISLWDKMPWNPISIFSQEYSVIALDQRNAGKSFGLISAQDSWNTYLEDQLALLDYLNIKKTHVIGACIAGAFIANLLATTPDRFASAAILQTIGYENNRDVFDSSFDQWQTEATLNHPETTAQDFAQFKKNLYDHDFVFSVQPEQLAGINVPIVVLQGDDIYHPKSISQQLATITGAQLIPHWKEPANIDAGIAAVTELFSKHTPAHTF